LVKEVLINAKGIVDNGDENFSRTVPSSSIWDVVNGAEELL
jgi:hypothetical protein